MLRPAVLPFCLGLLHASVKVCVASPHARMKPACAAVSMHAAACSALPPCLGLPHASKQGPQGPRSWPRPSRCCAPCCALPSPCGIEMRPRGVEMRPCPYCCTALGGSRQWFRCGARHDFRRADSRRCFGHVGPSCPWCHLGCGAPWCSLGCIGPWRCFGCIGTGARCCLRYIGA